MGRRRVEIKLIEDKAKMQTTFSKRREGLNKKTNEYAQKFNAQTAIITFSVARNCFAYGNPTVDDVLRRYQSTPQKMSGDDEDVDDEESESETEMEIDETLIKKELNEDVNIKKMDFQELFSSEIEKADLSDLAKLRLDLGDLKGLLNKYLGDDFL